MIHKVYDPRLASACFFRTAVSWPNHKVLLQITERCNFRCAHCFVDSTVKGSEMSLDFITAKVIPNFLKSNVSKVTLTGGEPLYHPDVKAIISSLCDAKISVSICTNASLIDDNFLDFVSDYPDVHFNVSLDGLYFESHGKFRGNLSRTIYDAIINNIEKLGCRNLLNGILATPNLYATIDEYDKLCHFAKKVGARYVLMNPLSPFGRGHETQTLAYSKEMMIALRNTTEYHNSNTFEVVYIRFPNDRGLEVSGCPLGSFPYVFTNGNVVICPYIVFASENDDNSYSAEQFSLYNIGLEDACMHEAINRFRLPNGEIICHEDLNGKGCCAIKVSKNLPLNSNDTIQ